VDLASALYLWSVFWGNFIQHISISSNIEALGIVAPGKQANIKTPPHLKE
jgi:hypothetical protein